MPVRLSLPLSLSLSLCLFRGSFSLQEIVYYNTSACKCYQIVSRLLILMLLSRKEKRREESPNSFFIFFYFLFYPRGRFRSSLLDILQFSLLSASDILLFSLIFFRFPICTGYSVFSFVCLLVVWDRNPECCCCCSSGSLHNRRGGGGDGDDLLDYTWRFEILGVMLIIIAMIFFVCETRSFWSI